MRVLPVIACAFLLAGSPAGTAAAENGALLSAGLSRHYTTNALDSPRLLDDWYSILRGSLSSSIGHDLGESSVTLEGELKRFDDYTFENDAALSVKGVTTVRPAEAVELRGSLAFGVVDEGSHLDLGETVLGLRTVRTMLEGDVQAGIRLGGDTTLVIEAMAARERPDATRFDDDVVPPLRLEATRTWLRAGARLTRTLGRFSYGLQGAAGLKRSGAADLLPSFDLADYSFGIQAGVTLPADATIAASIGLHRLDLRDTTFSQQRLAYQLVATAPLPGDVSLRGALHADYDMRTRDDPVAVWARRLEIEASYQPIRTVRFATGIFAEKRINVGMETTDRAQGLFVQAGWQANDRLTLSFRVEKTRKMQIDTGVERKALDIQFAANASL